MNRGDHLEVIFRDGLDPRLFLRTLDEGRSRTDWQIHSLCLMSNAQNLQQLRKAQTEKLKIAARLRAETTVTPKWIANHLSMRSPGSLSDRLRAARH
jgi:hypothetical protein